MNQTSDLNYLLNVKKILIEEIKILETSRSNPEYLDSLPIQNSEVRELVNSYKNTNSHINIDVSIQQKRELLKQVNKVLRKDCEHCIIVGHLDSKTFENRKMKYCIFCMNVFHED